MRAIFDFSKSEVDKFRGACNVVISKVGNGSRKATQAACEEILRRSMAQVPVDTTTLLNCASYKITGDYKTGWQGQVGYCIDIDYVNPKTGRKASEYVLAVHENLRAIHKHGKAKFLEDPAREFAQANFPRTVFTHVSASLATGGN